MHNPAVALKEMWRILKKEGALFVSVDIGGAPTPDEPTVFSADSLELFCCRSSSRSLILSSDEQPHSAWRPSSTRIMVRKKPQNGMTLDKEEILRRILARLGEHG